MLSAFAQSPFNIIINVASKQKLPARLQQCMKLFQRIRIYNAPLVVALLGPWVGIQDINPA